MNRLTALLKSLLDEPTQSRHEFLKLTGRALAIGTAGGLLTAYGRQGPQGSRGTRYAISQADSVPHIQPVSPPAVIPPKVDDPIQLEPIRGAADRQSPPTPSPQPPDQRVGYAVVGLGHLALENILPAFGRSRKSKLVALVSGNPPKT